MASADAASRLLGIAALVMCMHGPTGAAAQHSELRVAGKDGVAKRIVVPRGTREVEVLVNNRACSWKALHLDVRGPSDQKLTMPAQAELVRACAPTHASTHASTRARAQATQRSATRRNKRVHASAHAMRTHAHICATHAGTQRNATQRDATRRNATQHRVHKACTHARMHTRAHARTHTRTHTRRLQTSSPRSKVIFPRLAAT